MHTIFKILISLVISLGLFIALIFLSLSGYRSFVESELYQPAVIRAIDENLNKIAAVTEIWYSENKKLFSTFLENSSVKNSFEQEQTYADISMRENAAVELIASVNGLSGIRIIDIANQKIHFSTISSDIFSRSESMISYKKYGSNADDIPINFLTDYELDKIKITADPKSNLFLYSVPFYDGYDTYRGIAVFYVSEKALLKKLINEKKLALTDNLHLLTNPEHSFLGILMGLPYGDAEELKGLILSNWKTEFSDFNFISLDNKKEWILISAKYPLGYIGQICEKSIFLFPAYVKYFLITTAAITVFLVTFLLLNIKQDKLTTVQTKIQKLHLAILKNYIKNSESKTNDALKQELDYRRHDANAEIKRRLGKRFLKKNEKQVDDFLQASWDKIFAAISGKMVKPANNAEAEAAISSSNQEELMMLLRKLIAEVKSAPKKAAQVDVLSTDEQHKDAPSEEPVEELEELPSEEPVGELEELPNDEPVGELEELPSEEPVEELEELPSEDPVGELEELPSEEPVGELEELPSEEPVEELEELPSEEPVGELEELPSEEPVGELEELPSEEPVGELEELPSEEPVGELEELPSEEPVGELEELPNDEPVGELEELPSQESSGAVNIDEPIKFLEESGYTISGLDFSDLDIPISKLQEAEAEEVVYIDDNYDFQKSLWGKYSESPIQGILDPAGGIEIVPLINLDDEQTIINEDGIFVIKKTKGIEPENKDFKNLVDSVLN